MNYDIFNGDADGIVALLQLRLADPLEAKLVTGVKRDIKLVETVDAQAGDELTVLDVSMEKNMAGLEHALAQGAHVFYADHHKAGDIPQHGNLDAHIDLDANMCTALIVDKLLQGRFHAWAITAAYGDNLIAKADDLADLAGFSAEQKAQLKELGTLINYNGYGSSLDDLLFKPDELYRVVSQFTSPFGFITEANEHFSRLEDGYQEDMSAASNIEALKESDTAPAQVSPSLVRRWVAALTHAAAIPLANQLVPDIGLRTLLVP